MTRFALILASSILACKSLAAGECSDAIKLTNSALRTLIESSKQFDPAEMETWSKSALLFNQALQSSGTLAEIPLSKLPIVDEAQTITSMIGWASWSAVDLAIQLNSQQLVLAAKDLKQILFFEFVFKPLVLVSETQNEFWENLRLGSEPGIPAQLQRASQILGKTVVLSPYLSELHIKTLARFFHFQLLEKLKSLPNEQAEEPQLVAIAKGLTEVVARDEFSAEASQLRSRYEASIAPPSGAFANAFASEDAFLRLKTLLIKGLRFGIGSLRDPLVIQAIGSHLGSLKMSSGETRSIFAGAIPETLAAPPSEAVSLTVETLLEMWGLKPKGKPLQIVLRDLNQNWEIIQLVRKGDITRNLRRLGYPVGLVMNPGLSKISRFQNALAMEDCNHLQVSGSQIKLYNDEETSVINVKTDDKNPWTLTIQLDSAEFVFDTPQELEQARVLVLEKLQKLRAQNPHLNRLLDFLEIKVQ